MNYCAVIIHFARTFFERENDPESGSRPAAAGRPLPAIASTVIVHFARTFFERN